jgi:transcriptional regulator with XRE-family HTH domain
VLIGQKLREIRESKNLSQGDIERLTGLIRCYTSRVENGHTVPTIGTLEKYARALDVPLFFLFYGEKSSIEKLSLSPASASEVSSRTRGKESRELQLFVRALSQMNQRNQKLLLNLAQRLAARGKRPNR